MNRTFAFCFVLISAVYIVTKTSDASSVRCTARALNPLCSAVCYYGGRGLKNTSLPDCGTVGVTNYASCTLKQVYMTCSSSCSGAGTAFCDRSCAATNRTMSNDDEFYACNVDCNAFSTTPSGCANCPNLLTDITSVYYCGQPGKTGSLCFKRCSFQSIVRVFFSQL